MEDKDEFRKVMIMVEYLKIRIPNLTSSDIFEIEKVVRDCEVSSHEEDKKFAETVKRLLPKNLIDGVLALEQRLNSNKKEDEVPKHFS